MNKNPIEGRHDRASWHNTAKPLGSVVEVNGAVVRGSNAFLPGEIPPSQEDGKSAEVVVMRRETGGYRDARLNFDTGKLLP